MDLDRAWGSAASFGALAGVRVIDFGQYIAGPLAATMLADQGATVIRINPPGGPRLKAPANVILHRRRRTIELDLRDALDLRRAQALIGSADVVIENFRPGVAERLGIGPNRSRARSPRLVYCSLPGFGVTDPRAGQPGWEGVVMAAAGAYASDVSWTAIRGAADLPTAKTLSHLPLASVFGAMEAALGIAAALVARDRDGVGQWIEAPLFDALFEAIGNRAFSVERNKPKYTPFGSGFYHCSNGRFVAFFGGFFRHLEWLVEAMGKQAWVAEGLVNFERLKADPSADVELRQRLASTFATKSGEEWEIIGRTYRLPLGMLRSTAEWVGEPHATQSGTLIDVADPDLGRVRVPGSAVVLHGLADDSKAVRNGAAHDSSLISAIDAACEGASEADSVDPCHHPDDSRQQLPLAGTRVLDLTRILAAPTAAKLLAQLGADVIKIDQDPDKIQAGVPMPFAHEHVNRGKRTIVLDLKSPEGLKTFKRLAADADVIVQNSTMGAAERLGIDWASLSAASPRLIYVYLNANGREGPWSGNRGYADLATMLTGISARATGSNIPRSGTWVALHTPPWSYTDYAGGVLGAFGAVVALYDRQRSGNGRLVETSLLRATAIEQVLEIVEPIESDGQPISRPTSTKAPVNTIANCPLNRVYKTSDGVVFASIPAGRTDAVMRAFGINAELIGDDEEFAIAMAQALAKHSTSEAARVLLEAGAGAHAVVSVEKVMEPGGIAEQRGLRLEDKSPVHGTVIMPGPVIRFSSTPMRPGALPGPVGSDNDIVSAIACANKGKDFRTGVG